MDKELVYFVRNAEKFKGYPHALNKWTEATSEKGDFLGIDMLLDSLECYSCAFRVVNLSRVTFGGHFGAWELVGLVNWKYERCDVTQCVPASLCLVVSVMIPDFCGVQPSTCFKPRSRDVLSNINRLVLRPSSHFSRTNRKEYLYAPSPANEDEREVFQRIVRQLGYKFDTSTH